MLRILVLALLLANVALAAWQAGWLGPLARPAPTPIREPERLAQQIEPQRLRLLDGGGQSPAVTPAPVAVAEPSPQPPEPAAAPAAAARRCWQLPALPSAQAQALRRAAESQAGLRGRHTESSQRVPERWLVYLGPLPDAAALAARRAALRQAGLDQRSVDVPGVGPGLALGTYSSDEAARKALAEVQQRGVRDARVVRERAASETITLRWPDLTAPETDALKEALGPAGRQLAPCP
ncbi:MAG: SPOR domain-containing protein [Tepidimonas sp.]|uniref:SPOR domain-containing protein n=1 Tax=Tepidimonas sp. TaxID=2002775 RepID=UPI00298F00A1|nr:SPOR domain-containing protein [Tepidimonas sp.]MDW8335997.1 SPOR domain-containing protein [Tepidimonas sp.]